jgi:UDP-glucose 4-epimerase
MEKVLITGIAGGQGRLVALRLQAKHEVCGVDVSPWEGCPPDIRFHRVDLRKNRFEDIVRTERPTAVVHLGFIRHFRGDLGSRHDVNVRGTKQLLDHCAAYGVKQLVVVSSGWVYGALADNPYELEEDHALSASRTYPEIRDLVEVDTLASGFLWREQAVKTAILRPVGVLGRQARSMIGGYLRLERPPTVLGYDPMMQFLHEEDLSEAIAQSLEHALQGVYNVTGPGAVPLHTAIRETGGQPLPLPEALFRPLLRRGFGWGLLPWPDGAIDYLKFPVTLSGKRFEEETGFRPLFGLEETFACIER